MREVKGNNGDDDGYLKIPSSYRRQYFIEKMLVGLRK